MKSKKELESRLWSLYISTSNLSSQNNHSEYVKAQRAFQDKFHEEYHRNIKFADDILRKVDLNAKETSDLILARLNLNFTFRKKDQNR